MQTVHTVLLNNRNYDIADRVARSRTQYVYIPTPTREELQLDTILNIDIQLDVNDNFSNSVDYVFQDCDVFNPATGRWIPVPTQGIDVAMADSYIRLSRPILEFTVYRYRWKTSETQGSWHGGCL